MRESKCLKSKSDHDILAAIFGTKLRNEEKVGKCKEGSDERETKKQNKSDSRKKLSMKLVTNLLKRLETQFGPLFIPVCIGALLGSGRIFHIVGVGVVVFTRTSQR